MSAEGISRALWLQGSNPSQLLVLIHIGRSLDENRRYRFSPEDCESLTQLGREEIAESFDAMVFDGLVRVVSRDRFGVVVTLSGMGDG
jgi:hypothetical protein